MYHKNLNHNKQFMWAIMAMAIVVLCIVAIFMMWCVPAK